MRPGKLMRAGSMEYGTQQVWHNRDQTHVIGSTQSPFRYQRSLLVITSRAGTPRCEVNDEGGKCYSHTRIHLSISSMKASALSLSPTALEYPYKHLRQIPTARMREGEGELWRLQGRPGMLPPSDSVGCSAHRSCRILEDETPWAACLSRCTCCKQTT